MIILLICEHFKYLWLKHNSKIDFVEKWFCIKIPVLNKIGLLFFSKLQNCSYKF